MSDSREPIHVTFNFENRYITVSAFHIGKSYREAVRKYIDIVDINQYNSMVYIEIPLNHLIDETIPNESKWVFSWNQWNKKDQSLKIQQYVPFPVSNSLFHPNNYDPWTTLETWSFIANPSPYTNQTSDIKHKYNRNFYKLYDVTMEVIGKPAVADWSTKQSSI